MQDISDTRKQFEACVERCADSMYRVAWRLTGNSGDADDLVQESYIQAWQKIDSLRDPDRMRSWMFAILRNQFLKSVRKKKPVASPEVESVADHRTDESAVEENVDAVQQALTQLDEDQRMPILLVSMEGLSVDEASEILQIPRGTVLSRMHRGRQKLKELLNRSNE